MLPTPTQPTGHQMHLSLESCHLKGPVWNKAFKLSHGSCHPCLQHKSPSQQQQQRTLPRQQIPVVTRADQGQQQQPRFEGKQPEQLSATTVDGGQTLTEVPSADGAGTLAVPLSGVVLPEGLDEQEQRKRLWFAAVKPPMYTVALIPVLVGSAMAFAISGHFSAGHFWTVLFASINIIAWLNVSNDVFDHDKDTDKGKAESVVNLTGSRSKCFIASLLFFAVGAGTFFQLTSAAADDRFVKLLSAAIGLGYIYQGPPFRLSYLGLGEPLCFVAFGPLATTAFYLAQHYRAVGQLAAITPSIMYAATAVGVTTAVILFCSHFHQIEGDKAAGKISPLVRLGAAKGLKVLQAGCCSVYAVIALGIAVGVLPWTCGLVLASLPVLKTFLQFARDTHLIPEKVWPLKRYAIKWHTAFGLTLAIGLAAPGWLGLNF